MEENQNKSEETFSSRIDEIENSNADEVKTTDDPGALKIKRERLYSSEEFTAPSGGIGIKIKVKKHSPKKKKVKKQQLKTLRDQANLNISPSHSPSPSSRQKTREIKLIKNIFREITFLSILKFSPFKN